ncbi:ATP-binding protein [Arthrobacter woluwensis]|uniref:ATP-binding protein n=1 Tax=Arthrobacter woluwensis TaxID=156980 RepID=UPI0011A37DF1|nr:ATP-binding protein [Arthrobacter woluwensis]
MTQDREQWIATTHDWKDDLDVGHLRFIRERSGDYGRGGRRHQILEVAAYANDEAEAQGRTGLLVVTVRADGWVSVADDGRGTDTRLDAEGRVVRKPVMATRDLRFFRDPAPPLLPDGLPRRGMSTVAALSSQLIHENHRAEGSWAQRYRHGIPEDGLSRIDGCDATGTTVAFLSEAGDPRDLTPEDLTAFPWLTIRWVQEE